MAERTEYVQGGVWVDYEQPGWSAYQVLVTDETAQILSTTIAVAITLTLPRLLGFAKLLLPQNPKPVSPQEGGSSGSESLHDRELEPVRRESSSGVAADPGSEIRIGAEEDEPDQPLPPTLPAPRPAFFRMSHFSSRITSGLINTILDSSSLEEAVTRIAKNHLAMGTTSIGKTSQTRNSFLEGCSHVMKNFKKDTWSFTLVSALLVMLFGIFVGEQVVATSVTGIISGSIGLSKSPKCGNYIYSQNQPGFHNFEFEALAAAQHRATSYVDYCYGGAAVPESCNIYYNSTIGYSEEHNASCPFLGAVCLYGKTSAYALDTGFVDSSVLGINAPTRCQFRRRTTCSPLVMNSSYITYWRAVNRTDLSHIAKYDYGKNETSVITMIQPIDFSFGQHGYTATEGYYHFRVHGTSLHGALENREILRAEFQPPASDVSLLFIRPKDVTYSTLSDDPIFPADDKLEYSPHYWNSLPHATVLGCVDMAEIRHPETLEKWTPRNFTSWRMPSPEWEKSSMKNMFLLLGLALDRSNTWSAINLGVSLDAERRILSPGGTSLPLAREQWKVESRRFFEISLALAQGNVYDIVRGRFADIPGVLNTFMEVNQPACNMVKIYAVGWSNISLFWLVTLPTLIFLVWFASIEVSKKLILVWFYQILLKPWLPQMLAPILKLTLLALKWLIEQIPKCLSCLWRHAVYPNGLSWLIGKIVTAYYNRSDRLKRKRHRIAESSAFELHDRNRNVVRVY